MQSDPIESVGAAEAGLDGFRLVADVETPVTAEHAHPAEPAVTAEHAHTTDEGEEEEPTDDSEKAPAEGEALLWRALALESSSGRPVVVRPRRSGRSVRRPPVADDGTTEL